MLSLWGQLEAEEIINTTSVTYWISQPGVEEAKHNGWNDL